MKCKAETRKKGAVIYQNGWEWEININRWNVLLHLRITFRRRCIFCYFLVSFLALYSNISICRVDFEVAALCLYSLHFLLCFVFFVTSFDWDSYRGKNTKMLLNNVHSDNACIQFAIKEKPTIKIQFTTHERQN